MTQGSTVSTADDDEVDDTDSGKTEGNAAGVPNA